MRTIDGYEVPADGNTHTLKVRATALWTPRRIEARGDDTVEFWVEGEDTCPGVESSFTVVGTGHPLPDDAIYLGATGRTPSGLVWHLCRIGLPEPRTFEYPAGG